MKKLLIVMESSEQKKQLVEQLSGLYHVVSCSDGASAIGMVMDMEPDALVIDLMLSQMDGISTLEHIRNGGYRPKVIAITPFVSDYIISSLERMDVNCMLRYPCRMDQLVTRIFDVIDSQTSHTQQGREVTNILTSLGFKMNTSGFRITQLAIQMYVQDPNQKITAQLYPAVASCCDGTPSQVEKSIRDSIDSAWKNCNEKIWQMYFAAGKNNKPSKPTNGEFLARIGRCLIENNYDIIKNRKVC